MRSDLIIRWGFMPPEMRYAVREQLLSYLWLLPAWCRVLHVCYGGEHGKGPSVMASADATQEYRFARLVIHEWLSSNATERRLTIIHELLHIPTAPMVVEHQDVLNRLFEDGEAPKFKAKLDDTWRHAYESSVQDLAYAVLALPIDPLPRIPFVEEEDEPGSSLP